MKNDGDFFGIEQIMMWRNFPWMKCFLAEQATLDLLMANLEGLTHESEKGETHISNVKIYQKIAFVICNN